LSLEMEIIKVGSCYCARHSSVGLNCVRLLHCTDKLLLVFLGVGVLVEGVLTSVIVLGNFHFSEALNTAITGIV